MGSNFVTVHAVAPGTLDHIGSALAPADVDAAIADVATDHRQALASVLRGDYRHVEPETDWENGADPAAPDLIYAFSALLEKRSASSHTSEVYVDLDETPVLWEFALAGEAGESPLQLPFSPEGSPAIRRYGAREIATFVESFEASPPADESFFPEEERSGILRILRSALEGGLDVIVVYSE
jgi:hypothetical protein